MLGRNRLPASMSNFKRCGVRVKVNYLCLDVYMIDVEENKFKTFAYGGLDVVQVEGYRYVKEYSFLKWRRLMQALWVRRRGADI